MKYEKAPNAHLLAQELLATDSFWGNKINFFGGVSICSLPMLHRMTPQTHGLKDSNILSGYLKK